MKNILSKEELEEKFGIISEDHPRLNPDIYWCNIIQENIKIKIKNQFTYEDIVKAIYNAGFAIGHENGVDDAKEEIRKVIGLDGY